MNVPHDIGFEVGHTDRPKTIGAMIWPETIQGNGNCNFSYIVIDTEGIGSGIQTYDKALLMVAMVLSSRLIYHLDGYVYFDDITKLYSIANLALYYEQRGLLSNSKKRGELLPPITWMVQRYKLEHESSEKTPLDVLMNVWMKELDNRQDDALIERYNTTIRIVKSVFPNHTVHLIPDPTDCSGSERSCHLNHGEHLTDIDHDDLFEGYVREMSSVRDEIFDCSITPPKGKMGGLTGNEIASILEEIIKSANLGIEYIGEKITDMITRTHVDSCLKRMEDDMNKVILPLSENDLDIRLQTIRRNTEDSLITGMPTFSSNVSVTTGSAKFVARQYLDELGEKYVLVRIGISEKNSAASDKFCDEMVDVAYLKFSNPKEFHGDLGIFDKRSSEAVAGYDSKAIGPRSGIHRSKLYEKIRLVRDTVAADGAPKRHMIWALASGFAVLLCHILADISTKISQSHHAWTFFSTVELLSIFVSGMAAWSMLGTPPINFDLLADTLVYTFKLTFSPITACKLIATIMIALILKTSIGKKMMDNLIKKNI